MVENGANRTGGTSRRSGNPPVVSVSGRFIPKSDPPDVLDEDGLLDRAASKGFSDADTEQARYFLRRIGYAYASDYFRFFSGSGDDGLKAIHQAIIFDRRVQSVLMRYIGLFELQFRAQYAYFMSLEGGAFAHRDPSNFKNRSYFDSFLREYGGEVGRQLKNKNGKMAHLVELYGDAPVWQAVQVMSFGMLSKLYRNTRSKTVRTSVADSFGVSYDELTSWMRTITYVRNKCAHFAQVAGTRLVVAPRKIRGVNLANTHPFYTVLILEKLLSTDDGFQDDTSLMYSLNLAKDFADVVGTTPVNIASKFVPANWKALLTRRDIVGADFRFIPSKARDGVFFASDAGEAAQ